MCMRPSSAATATAHPNARLIATSALNNSMADTDDNKCTQPKKHFSIKHNDQTYWQQAAIRAKLLTNDDPRQPPAPRRRRMSWCAGLQHVQAMMQVLAESRTLGTARYDASVKAEMSGCKPRARQTTTLTHICNTTQQAAICTHAS